MPCTKTQALPAYRMNWFYLWTALTIETKAKIVIKINVIVAPGGVPQLYEVISPLMVPIKAIRIPIPITPLKLLAKRIEIAAGKIKMAATSNAPMIGIIIAIVTPVKILNKIDMRWTGKPNV